ncbi:unnamed protein product [Polarella glacialis]|uniref:Uncharacterized protein n=1 Tax=Polarella glacialis TaxID=89957 RepID=A0A813H4L2_POLGL|nr:unnamed protein product [Polarella glacialis]CAE8688823.1 unnamed protein product [Polarella glacialis]CAE8726260.1 unnamed protein product [Polarella glacialis]
MVFLTGCSACIFRSQLDYEELNAGGGGVGGGVVLVGVVGGDVVAANAVRPGTQNDRLLTTRSLNIFIIHPSWGQVSDLRHLQGHSLFSASNCSAGASPAGGCVMVQSDTEHGPTEERVACTIRS